MPDKPSKISGLALTCFNLGALPAILQFGIFLSVSLVPLGPKGESLSKTAEGIFVFSYVISLFIALPATIVLTPVIIILSIISLMKIRASKGQLSGTYFILGGFVLLLVPLIVFLVGLYGFKLNFR